nr:DUF1801 domain-containing protein [uncultured Sphaerochaeta sp.]
MKSNATTVQAYIDSLTFEHQAVILPMRSFILSHLPEGMQENISWGMLSYEVPLEVYPTTYNKKPLLYAAIAAQKQYYSLYLMGVYLEEDRKALLQKAFEKSGKRLSMGKSCIRFKRMEDLPLDLIGQMLSSHTIASYIALYELNRK